MKSAAEAAPGKPARQDRARPARRGAATRRSCTSSPSACPPIAVRPSRRFCSTRPPPTRPSCSWQGVSTRAGSRSSSRTKCACCAARPRRGALLQQERAHVVGQPRARAVRAQRGAAGRHPGLRRDGRRDHGRSECRRAHGAGRGLFRGVDRDQLPGPRRRAGCSEGKGRPRGSTRIQAARRETTRRRSAPPSSNSTSSRSSRRSAWPPSAMRTAARS